MKIALIALLSGFVWENCNYRPPEVNFYLSDKQEEVRNVAYKVAKENCLEDICFTKTLQAISWQESSFGKNLIGDDRGEIYYFKDKGQDILVKKKETFLDDGIRYTYFQPFKNRYIKKVYSRIEFKPINDSSLGAFQIKMTTAQRVIRERKLIKYDFLLLNDKQLINSLLNDVEFSAEIAVNYLIMNYEVAKKRGHERPWRYAVSKYNGGSNNIRYINKISDKIKQL